MGELLDLVRGLSAGSTILLILILALVAHVLVLFVRRVGRHVMERDVLERVVQGTAAQHSGIVVRKPEVLGVRAAEPGGWRYLRVKLHIWPGQGSLLETTLRQRVLAALRSLSADYADWMVTVTYRVEG